MTDRSGVRDEDAFDVPAMDTWLRTQVTDLPDDLPAVEQFTKGASNLTYRLDYLDRSLVLRRPPSGTKAASAHDMGREVHVLEHLAKPYPYVPTVRAYCTDESVIGSPFYVMDYLEGTILRPDNSSVLTPELAADVGRVYVDRWADLHSVDIDAAGLADWGKGPGYVDRQVFGWSDRFRRARTADVPDGERRYVLAGREPSNRRRSMCHPRRLAPGQHGDGLDIASGGKRSTRSRCARLGDGDYR
jgi:aminoglycoside phosphotransferase (APT) family kinase protein